MELPPILSSLLNIAEDRVTMLTRELQDTNVNDTARRNRLLEQLREAEAILRDKNEQARRYL